MAHRQTFTNSLLDRVRSCPNRLRKIIHFLKHVAHGIHVLCRGMFSRTTDTRRKRLRFYNVGGKSLLQVRYSYYWNESWLCYQESLKYPDELAPLQCADYDRAHLNKRLIVTEPLRGWALFEEKDDILWITHLARFRGTLEPGIGSLLIYALETEADRKGKQIILLGVNIQNTNAIRFYEKHGFEDFGQLVTRHGTFLVLGKGTIHGGDAWRNIGLNFMEQLT